MLSPCFYAVLYCTLIVLFTLSCGCLIPVSLPHSDVSWSVVCDLIIFWSHLLMFFQAYDSERKAADDKGVCSIQYNLCKTATFKKYQNMVFKTDCR